MGKHRAGIIAIDAHDAYRNSQSCDYVVPLLRASNHNNNRHKFCKSL